MTYLAIPLLIFKIYVMDEWQVSGKLVITALLVASIISWRTAQYPELMITMAFVLGARSVDFKQVARWYLYLSVTLLLVIAATSLVNIVPNLVYVSNLRPNRYGLGMAYTTFVASHLFFSALAYCSVRFGKLKWFDYIGIAVVATIAMVYTDTRLRLLCNAVDDSGDVGHATSCRREKILKDDCFLFGGWQCRCWL